MTIMQDSRNHEITIQEVVYLKQRLTLQVFVCHLQMHMVRLLIRFGTSHFL